MNTYIAAVVDELYELGIRDIVISPGARSTPLSMWFCEHKFDTYLQIDERCAGFFALGIAKEKNVPVVLVCTSGSALAHYLPAIIEASHARLPLIILSADRPYELQYVGAPQTMNQNQIFGNFTKYYQELSIPSSNENSTIQDFRNARIIMQKAYIQCECAPKGVVHINVPLRDPLTPNLDKNAFSLGRFTPAFSLQKSLSHFLFSEAGFVGFAERARLTTLSSKKGLIICGTDSAVPYHEEIIRMAENLKAPILADPLSGLRSFNSSTIIDSYDSFLKEDSVKKELIPDYILLFGQAPVSKRLYQFLALHHEIECFQISESPEYRNPALSTNTFILGDAKSFIQQIKAINTDDEYLKKWQSYQTSMREKLNSAKQETLLFEGKIIQILQENIPKESRLLAANSMSIRDIDYFWQAKKQDIKIMGNRGVNGIDGTISTAFGIATNKKPTILLTGDLAFFHDMNGLLIGKTHNLNLIIILMNNNGGGIFQYLPQHNAKHFDYLFSTPHGMDFQGLEQIYNLNYTKIDSYQLFTESLTNALAQKTNVHIIEVPISMQTSKELHDIYTQV